MTNASLPKMIAFSPDSKTIAISHWGDNSVSLIDISSGNPKSFSHLYNIVVVYKINLNFSSNTKIDRDNNCGNGIAIIDIAKRKYLGTVTGMKTNMLHLIIKDR